jgi:hypothetical protein
MDHKRYTSGYYVFNLFGGAICWMIKIRARTTLSNIEVEYMTSTYERNETLWL